MKTTSLTLIFVMASLVMTACQPKDAKNVTQSPAGRQTTPGAPATQAGGQPSDGTGDFGGGNGRNNKVFESYIIQVRDLPEYKNLLEPISTKIDPLMNDPKDPGDSKEQQKRKQNQLSILEALASTKTWYLAPISLAQIEKDKLGVEFSKDPIQQLAIQTDHEVWIDASIYHKMNQTERAQLILHEIVMIWYQARFLSLKDLCLKMATCQLDDLEKFEQAIKLNPKMASKFEPEPKRPLSTKDYSMIRGATGYLFQNYALIKEHADYLRFVQTFNFDRRFYGNSSSDWKQDNYELSEEAFQKVVTESLSVNLPDHKFTILDTDTPERSILSFQSEKQEIVFDKYKVPVNLITMNVRTKTTNESIQFEHSAGTIKGSGLFKCPSGVDYCFKHSFIEHVPHEERTHIKIGHELRGITLYFSNVTYTTRDAEGKESEYKTLRLDTVRVQKLTAVKRTMQKTDHTMIEYGLAFDQTGSFAVSAATFDKPNAFPDWDKLLLWLHVLGNP